MADARPLMRLGIRDLEDLFVKQGRDLPSLARLKQELSHRQVPRAVALLDRIHKVEAELKHLQPVGPIANPAIESEESTPELPFFEPGQQIPVQRRLLPELQTHPQAPDVSIPVGLPTPEVITVGSAEGVTPIPQLSLEDAFRVLKVGVGDAWEKIETARRKIVVQSSPLATHGVLAPQVQKLLGEAKMANDAAIVIAARRSGRQ